MLGYEPALAAEGRILATINKLLLRGLNGMITQQESSNALTGHALLVAKSDQENKQNDCRANRGNHPDRSPVMNDGACGRRCSIHIDDLAADPASYEHADTVGNEDDQPLRGGAQGLRRLRVDKDLSGDEEEVVADA